MFVLIALFLLQTSSAHEYCAAFSRCRSDSGEILPQGVSWMQAHFTRSHLPGNVVRPLGVTLKVGISERNILEGNVELLHNFLGVNASQEFMKNAILFKQHETPKYLTEMLTSQKSIPTDMFNTDVLIASWHGTADLGWSSRFLEMFQGRNNSFTVFRSRDDDTICFCSSKSLSELPNIQAVSLKRTLDGSGSHRQLHSSIILKFPKSFTKQQCVLILLEHLPNSIFADGFELHRMTQKAALKEAHIYGDLDLERPAFFSRQSIVELHKPLRADGSFMRTDFLLPLHVRYAPLSMESHYLVNLSLPQVFVDCKNIIKPAEWSDLSDISSDIVRWEIPAGNLAHAAFVPIFTALLAASSTIILTVSAIYSTQKIKPKTL